MSTTLTNGLKLPDKGSVDWYADMQNNYTILDGAVGTIADHTTALTGKAPLVHTHTKSDVTDLLNSNFIPSANNSYDLGSSSYQWKTLNGINPGALSLPGSGSSRVDISSSIKDLTGADISYTPTVNGWLMLRIDGAVGNFLYVQQSSYGFIDRVDGTGTEYIYLLIPFQANVALTIKVKGTSGLIARYYPCLGNV